MAKDYNNIYRLLVKDKSDTIGRIAYSLYKEEKIVWIRAFKTKEGRKPTDEEVEKLFHEPHRQRDCLDRYRLHAESILQEFTDAALDESTTQIEAECYGKIDERLKLALASFSSQLPRHESLLARYGHGIAQSILAAIILAVVIWLLIAVVGKFSIGDLQIEFKKKPVQTELVETPPQVPEFRQAPEQ
ncbi:MAG: hypothetical protein IJ637_06735 [Prevotella sp.]|nr:hypothetical protein [Prevotella sp.]